MLAFIIHVATAAGGMVFSVSRFRIRGADMKNSAFLLFYVFFLCCPRFGFNPEEHFTVPADVTEHFAGVKESGSRKEADYHTLFAAYEVTHITAYQTHCTTSLLIPTDGPTITQQYWSLFSASQQYRHYSSNRN